MPKQLYTGLMITLIAALVLAAVVLLDRAGKIKRTGLPATPDSVGTGVPDGPSSPDTPDSDTEKGEA